MNVNRNFASVDPHGISMQRQLLIAIGGGLLSAALSLGLISGGGSFAMLAYVSPLPLILAGLSAGFRSTAIAGVVGFATLVAASGGFAAAAIFAASVALPSWIIVYHAVTPKQFANGGTGWHSPGEIISRLSVVGAIFLSVVMITRFGDEGGLTAAVRDFLRAAIMPYFHAADEEQVALLVGSLLPLFPAFATMSWLVTLVLNAVIAQRLLVKSGLAQRPSPNYRTIEVPEWAYWLLIAAAAGKLLSGGDLEYLLQNLVVVFAVPFFFVGLGVAHTMVRRLTFPGIALFFFYFSLLLFSWLAAVVAALGFAEQWVGLRQRFGRPPQNQPEDE